MEEIYMNAEYDKFDNAKNCTGPRKYKIPKEFLPRHRGVILCLGLLSFFLLIGLITLGVYFHDSAADVSAVGSKLSSMTEERDLLKANLSTTRNKLSSMTEERDLLKANLSTNRNKLSSMTEERDLLQANLAEKTNELERLQSLSKQNKACPAGWSRFSYSCYLLSETSGSWDVARKDCRDRGADLVVIDSPEDQTALSNIATTEAWIGLNDKEQEGTWKWVDGTPLTLIPAGNWEEDQPDNGGGSSHWGEEDCVHVRTDTKKSWNDRSCSTSFKWICEKTP